MRSFTRLAWIVFVCIGGVAHGDSSGFVKKDELAASSRWVAERFSGDAAKLPFSFKLADESSATVLGRSKLSVTSEVSTIGRIAH